MLNIEPKIWLSSTVDSIFLLPLQNVVFGSEWEPENVVEAADPFLVHARFADGSCRSPIAWNPFFGKRFERVEQEPFVLTDLTTEQTMLQDGFYRYQCNNNMSCYDMQTLT